MVRRQYLGPEPPEKEVSRVAAIIVAISYLSLLLLLGGCSGPEVPQGPNQIEANRPVVPAPKPTVDTDAQKSVDVQRKAEQDSETAALLKQIAEKGNRHERKVLPPSLKKCDVDQETYSNACSGDAQSQFSVAFFIRTAVRGIRRTDAEPGQASKPDLEAEAFRWAKKAAAQKNLDGLVELAHQYEIGCGTKIDFHKARLLYTKAYETARSEELKSGAGSLNGFMKVVQDDLANLNEEERQAQAGRKTEDGTPVAEENVSDTAGNTMYKVGDTIELFSANDAPVPLAMSFPAIKEFKDVCKKGVSNKSLSAKQASRMVELGQLVLVPSHSTACVELDKGIYDGSNLLKVSLTDGLMQGTEGWVTDEYTRQQSQ